MESLMHQIYQNALRTKLDPDASPIDLSWSSRRVCDRLIVPEDLRPESYVTKDNDTPVRVKLVHRFHQSGFESVDRSPQTVSESLFTSSDSAIDSSLSETSSVCSDDNFYIKQEPDFQGRQPSSHSENQGRQSPHHFDNQGRQPSHHSDNQEKQSSPHSVNQGRQLSSQSHSQGRELHPFSIESLIDCTDIHVKVDIPAVITSTYTKQLKTSISVNPYFIPGLSMDTANTIGSSLMSCDMNTAYWCHVCNALCVNYKDAQSHQYSHKIQNVKCTLRKSMFSKIGYVSQHDKLDDEKMKCGLCNKIVANCFFTKHQRLHDGHICNICDAEFSTNSRLKDHMNIHTGNTPFTCKLCDRKFAKRSSLTQHQRYHRDHQSFKCSYCSKYFNSKYACNVHERLHTGDNPFKCQILGCKRSFPQKIQLTLHMNSHRC
ncbi:hypothetical protein ACF0H5_000271 [Mactra antiquata]